ncbi:MAG: molybdopterin converting factor subunit 1, partial [Pseudomonadota bacterium]
IDAETISLPQGVNDLQGLRRFLAARGEVWSEAFAEDKALRAAINQELVKASASLRDQAEVAFFPPVTGG